MVAPKDTASKLTNGVDGMHEDVEGEVDMEIEVGNRNTPLTRASWNPG